jgi:hypothetical protein
MRIQTRITLWKIRWQQFLSDRRFKKLVKKSGKTADACCGEEWYADSACEDLSLDSDERQAISNELLYQARKCYLPTPSLAEKEKWDEGAFAVPYMRDILTAEAMMELRSAIRKEQAERRAVLEWWLKILGGLVGILTGLVGALIGLFAIMKK